jgi:hypothetical protein
MSCPLRAKKKRRKQEMNATKNTPPTHDLAQAHFVSF